MTKKKAMGKGKCPYCHSVRTVWRGYRYNEKTTKRLMKCSKCGRKFTPDDGYFRMRFSPEEIAKAVKLYAQGFSSAEVVKHLKRRGVGVSRWTVLTWYRKYAKTVKTGKRR